LGNWEIFKKFYPFFGKISINYLFAIVYAKKTDLDTTGKIGIISTIGKTGEVGRCG